MRPLSQFYFLIIVMLFLACKNEGDQNANNDDTTGQEQSQLVLPYKKFTTSDKIPWQEAYDFRQKLLNSNVAPLLPKSILITREALEALVADSSVDGVRVYPIMYDPDVQRNDVTFRKGSVGFVLTPNRAGITEISSVDVDNMWDYNSPCPPKICDEIPAPPAPANDTTNRKK